MTILDSAKVDLLYKKLFGAAKSDLPGNKGPANEATASPFINRGDKIYVQASAIPTVAAAVSGIVASYNITNRIQCTADATTTPVGGVYPTWKTGLSDWIPPEFGSTYFVKAYVGVSGLSDPATTGGTQIFDSGSGGTGEWWFDYQAGVLNFIGGTIPAVLTASNVIYIYGYRYIGALGASNIIAAGTDTAISTSSGIVTIYSTATLQSITNRGATTTNAINIANTSGTTSTATGALSVLGGVGIGGGLYVGGTITATNISMGGYPLSTLTSITAQYFGNPIGSFNAMNFATGTTATITGSTITVQALGSAGTTVSISDIPPLNPNTGNLWWDSSVGILRIYYADPNSSQWVDAFPIIQGPTGAQGPAGTAFLGTTTFQIITSNTTQSTSTNSGALQVAGGAGIGGDLYVGGNIVANQLTIQYTTVTTNLVTTDDIIITTNNTSATSTTTGALRITGGAGIGGALYVGNTSYIAGAQILTTATIGSYAVTSSAYATTSSLAAYATTASIAAYATTSSIATSAAYATTSSLASYATTASIATSAAYATTSSLASYATTASIATSAAYATTASIAATATNAAFAYSFNTGTLVTTAVNLQGGTVNATTGQFSNTSYIAGAQIVTTATIGTYAVTSSGYATTSSLAAYATTSSLAAYATTASLASYATTASIATSAAYATTASLASYATTSSIATSAAYATTSSNAAYATTSSIATSAAYATTASLASYATTASLASYATTASIASTATSAAVAYSLANSSSYIVGYASTATNLNGGSVNATTVVVNSTLSSTSSYSGNALYVAGGIGGNSGFNINGNGYLNGNLTVNGSVTATSVVFQGLISANSGTFYGDLTGSGALYAGVNGYTPFAQTMFQATGNLNNYMEINVQNINAGPKASTDIVASADNVTANSAYIDMGIASSVWDGSQLYSLGQTIGPNDGYLMVGQNGQSGLGDLIFGTTTTGTQMRFVIAATATTVTNASIAIVMNQVNTPSNSTASGTLIVNGGVGIAGDTYVGGNLTVLGTINATISGIITTATNITGGLAGQIHMQTGAGATSFIAAGTTGQLLQSQGSTASFVSTTTLQVGNALYATTSSIATSAAYATTASLASYATTASTAAFATTATNAFFASTATNAFFASTSTNAGFAYSFNTSTVVTTAVNQQGGSVNATTGVFSGVTTVTNITASTTTATGALQVAGGVGIGKNINVGPGATNRNIVNANAVGNMFTAAGDSQYVNYILGIKTTTNAATGLSTDHAAAGAANQIILPNSSAYGFRAYITARDTVNQWMAVWEVTGGVRRGATAASTTLVGTPVVTRIAYDTTATTWAATAVADTTNGGLQVRVTGTGTQSITWVANVLTIEVA